MHDKTIKMTCAPSEDSYQPGHLPSLIRVFAMCFMGSQGPNPSSGRQWRPDAQADLSFRCIHVILLVFLATTQLFMCFQARLTEVEGENECLKVQMKQKDQEIKELQKVKSRS